MGDMADDAYNAAMKAEEDRQELLALCEEPEPRKCEFKINDDGLFECSVCGKVTDL